MPITAGVCRHGGSDSLASLNAAAVSVHSSSTTCHSLCSAKHRTRGSASSASCSLRATHSNNMGYHRVQIGCLLGIPNSWLYVCVHCALQIEHLSSHLGVACGNSNCSRKKGSTISVGCSTLNSSAGWLTRRNVCRSPDASSPGLVAAVSCCCACCCCHIPAASLSGKQVRSTTS